MRPIDLAAPRLRLLAGEDPPTDWAAVARSMTQAAEGRAPAPAAAPPVQIPGGAAPAPTAPEVSEEAPPESSKRARVLGIVGVVMIGGAVVGLAVSALRGRS